MHGTSGGILNWAFGALYAKGSSCPDEALPWIGTSSQPRTFFIASTLGVDTLPFFIDLIVAFVVALAVAFALAFVAAVVKFETVGSDAQGKASSLHVVASRRIALDYPLTLISIEQTKHAS